MLFKTLTLMLGMVMSLSLTSCSDDDNDEEPNPNTVAKLEVNYTVDLTQTWYDFYDIQVTYITPGGTPKTETISMDWNLNFELSYNEAPNAYSISVDAKPKVNPVEVVDGLTYTFEYECNMSVEGTSQNGSTLFFYSEPKSGKFSSGGDALRNTIQSERHIFSGSYNISK